MGGDREIDEWLRSGRDPAGEAMTQFGVKKSRRAKLRPIIERAIEIAAEAGQMKGNP